MQAWLTHAVFRQGSVASLPARLRDCPAFRGEERYLDWAASTIAAAVKTKEFAIVGQAGLDPAAASHAPVAGPPAVGRRAVNWAEAVVPIRLGQGNSRLSCWAAARAASAIWARTWTRWPEPPPKSPRRWNPCASEEMTRLVSQAELRALQSQINPHFLFNALNTLYGTIPRESSAARRMVLNLADIFRYFLQSDKTFVTLAEEMQIVRAYLEVEQSRLGDRLAVQIDVDDAALPVPIPVLSIQPLVENAIKHGVAQRTEPGFVHIAAIHGRDGLRVTVENSGAPRGSTVPGAGWGSKTCAAVWRFATARRPICASTSSRIARWWNCAFHTWRRRRRASERNVSGLQIATDQWQPERGNARLCAFVGEPRALAGANDGAAFAPADLATPRYGMSNSSVRYSLITVRLRGPARSIGTRCHVCSDRRSARRTATRWMNPSRLFVPNRSPATSLRRAFTLRSNVRAPRIGSKMGS